MHPLRFRQRRGILICALLLASMLLLTIARCPLRAQSIAPPPPPAPPAPPPEKQSSALPPAPPCIGCYKGFKFDTVFRMGAHFNGAWPGAPQFLKDTLHIGITQMYHQPYLWEIVRDTVLSGGNDARSVWANKLRLRFWQDLKAADVRLIMEPGEVSAIAKGSEMSEAYFGQAKGDTIQQVAFLDYAHEDTNDRQLGSFVWGGLFKKAPGDPMPLRMAGGPQWTAMGIAQNGYYLPSMSADAGLHDLTVAIKVATTSTEFIDLDGTALIAYAKVYRRIPVGQDSCGCNLYEYIDSLPITKAVYLDTLKSDITVGKPDYPYRDVTFSFRIKDTTFTVANRLVIEYETGKFITALDTGRTYNKYTPRGGFLKDHPVRGNFHGDTNGTGYARYCGLLKRELGKRGYYDSTKILDRDGLVVQGDFGYEVYTTRKVDVTFMRGRLAPHTYALLRRGAFNDAIKQSVYTVFDDTTLGGAMNKQMFRFGVVDEASIEKYRGFMDVASRVQRAILDKDPNDTRGIWSNPQRRGPASRVLSGDLDSTAIKMVHMSANQWYNYGGLVPVAYANPDSMNGSAALTSLYPATGPMRAILYNANDDYQLYTLQTMKANNERIDQLVQMTNASRYMFRHIRRESYPVYSVIHIQGYLDAKRDANGNKIGYNNGWFFPNVTPEEGSVQSWLALNCSVDGIWFGDFVYDDAFEFGVMHWLTGDHASNYQDSLNSGDPTKQGNPNWMLPKMWTGFKDRFAAVKRITDEFHTSIIPVFQKLDRTTGIRMNVWRDTIYSAMPMIDTLYTMRAARFKVSGKYMVLVDTAGGRNDTAYDRQDSTFMVATVFQPGPYDTSTTSRYMVVTNLRCWPYDEKRYSSYVSSFHANDSVGLGAIDARRPVVVFKNSTGIIADSARIQRVGDTAVRFVAFGNPVMLDWLDPGWGALYTITPIAKPISTLGTAYNNAVHSINPSTNGSAQPRLFVYERDSAIYLRALDSTGRWGAEWLISAAADMDTITVGGKKRIKADNTNPAIDISRNGSSCAIVWQRRTNPGNAVSVEMAWLPFRPTVKTFPHPDSIKRVRLSTPRQFAQSWMQLTPSITGVDSGYVVAWAAANYTTEVKAVRDRPDSLKRDTSRVLRVKMVPTPPRTLDSAMGYPTLAYARNWQEVPLNDGIISGPNDNIAFRTMPVHVDGIADTMGSYHIAHLAYQQGPRGGTRPFDIIYHRIGVRFPIRANGIPELWGSPAEEVSYNISGCNRIYPSIAVDSVHVGVTFTLESPSPYVVLRFRDMSANTPRRLRWNTVAYTWGGKQGTQASRSYSRSSMVMFPSRDTTSMAGAYEGAMTWRWIDAGGGRQHGVKLYRFGEFMADSLLDGDHPTMMLVPSIGNTATRAMIASGIFRRGPAASQFQLRRQRGDTGVYYPAYFDNTPVSPIIAFGTPAPTATINAEGIITKKVLIASDCAAPAGGISTTLVLLPRKKTSLDTLPPPPPPTTVPPSPPWTEWGMPPTFFPKTPGWRKAVMSVSDLMSITRTPTFPVDTSAATITRIMAGNDSLIAWLNSEPYDPVYNIPANIFYSIQIVRDSDDVVLWMGDTISARGIAEDTITEELILPLTSVTSVGTKVYIRLAMTPTNGLTYEMTGGFRFIDDTAGSTAAKRSIYRNAEASPMTGEAIVVRMIPNPMQTTSGELHVIVAEPGEASIGIYDLLGNRVMTIPSIEAKHAGEYAIPVDLSGLRNGMYIVDVRTGHSRGSTPIILVR